MYDKLPGLAGAAAQERVLHAWKAGPQTLALRRQLEAMPDGGVYALHVPLMPYRCPPGPYERACQVAFYFKQHKPRSKVLVLDANPDIQSKKALFEKAWKDRYAGIIEYRPNSSLVDVDAQASTLKFEFEDVKAAVLNVVPPQRAGAIARELGMATANARFCEVDFLSFESKVQPGIHVLGDAIQTAPGMPKSASMANQQARVCAAAIVALLDGQAVNPQPIIINACYSFVDDREAMHVTSVHRYDAEKKTLLTVAGSGGVSSSASEVEGKSALAWAKNIWADTLA
jgi:NADPH-dependent 2,4-dienoyl-CoA reductase/sulfur reductase-like enzyme